MSGNFSLQWHITNRCDQRCRHCYIFNSSINPTSQEWDIELARKLLNEFACFCEKYDKNPNLAITGGDPILHPQFWEIIHEVSKHHIPFVILGNPFNVGKNELQALKEAGCWCYQVSIDGTRDTHDAIRMKGSFDATIDWLKMAKRHGFKCAVMTTVSRTNIDEIPQIAELVTSIGVDIYAFARYCPTHNDANLNPSPEEYHNFLNKMWKFYEQNAHKNTTYAFKDHLWKALLYEKGMLELEEDDSIIYDGCHCGFTHLTLLETGTFYACRRMDSPIGHFPENSIEEVFFGKELDRYRRISEIDGCKDCKLLRYCRGCRAVASGTNGGNFLSKDPQCWLCH